MVELYTAEGGTLPIGYRNCYLRQAELYTAAELYPSGPELLPAAGGTLHSGRTLPIGSGTVSCGRSFTQRQAEPHPAAGETFPSAMQNFINGLSSRAVILLIEIPDLQLLRCIL